MGCLKQVRELRAKKDNRSQPKQDNSPLVLGKKGKTGGTEDEGEEPYLSWGIKKIGVVE